MKDKKKEVSFFSCRTIPQALTLLYLTTFSILILLGLFLIFLTGYSPMKLAVLLLILGIYLAALVFAVLATRNLPGKQRIRKYKKLLKEKTSLDLAALADQTGISQEELRQDLLLLINDKIFPDAGFSNDGSFFYLNNSEKKPDRKDTV